MAEQEKHITIQKIYTKDFSFESPQAPGVFTKTDWEPKTNLNLRSTHNDLGDNNHDVVLTLTVETKHEDKTLFLVELHQPLSPAIVHEASGGPAAGKKTRPQPPEGRGATAGVAGTVQRAIRYRRLRRHRFGRDVSHLCEQPAR